MSRGSLNQRIVALAGRHRPAGPPPFDPWLVASSLDIEVLERPLTPTLLGARLPSGRIVLNESISHRRKRTTLAHEIAHHLVAVGSAPWVSHRDEEQFCDAFAWELLAPHELLDSAPASVFQVPDAVLLTQRATLGRPSALSAQAGEAVICQRCGAAQRGLACTCSASRSSAGAVGTG